MSKRKAVSRRKRQPTDRFDEPVTDEKEMDEACRTERLNGRRGGFGEDPKEAESFRIK